MTATRNMACNARNVAGITSFTGLFWHSRVGHDPQHGASRLKSQCTDGETTARKHVTAVKALGQRFDSSYKKMLAAVIPATLHRLPTPVTIDSDEATMLREEKKEAAPKEEDEHVMVPR